MNGTSKRALCIRLAAVAILAGCFAGCSLSGNSSSGGSTSGSTSGTGSGSGGGTTTHSVSLTWKASASSNVVGYNVYRGTVAGSYGLLNSMNAGTSYDDATVQNGQTYYYVVTAVDSGGAESAYSNQSQAVIP